MIGAVSAPIAQSARERVSKATGLPEDRTFIAATHTHSVPGLAKQELECIQKYTEQLIVAMAETAVAALADRKEAKLYAGSMETENLNFIKHYKVRDNETGYLPSAVAYKYGSYEVDVTHMAPGTGEMVADTYIEMLKELKN